MSQASSRRPKEDFDVTPYRRQSPAPTSDSSSSRLEALLPRWRDVSTRLQALSAPRSLLSSGPSFALRPISRTNQLVSLRTLGVAIPKDPETLQLHEEDRP